MDRRQLTWLFFGFSGRIGRMAYFLAGLLLAIFQAFFLYRFMEAGEDTAAGQAWAMGFWFIFAVTVWSYVALGVKRLHDFGKPGILVVSLFIPVVSIIVFVVLCLYPGNPGPNEHGEHADAEP